ncbi:hypothetical protein [Novosphingobium sp. M1R2S20]|uniref:Uncharacterized protein n=1 Tax=Novosphingobium rhizovicinum TaxID=3228928 RepID=A0ABV3RD76_9SPHN
MRPSPDNPVPETPTSKFELRRCVILTFARSIFPYAAFRASERRWAHRPAVNDGALFHGDIS